MYLWIFLPIHLYFITTNSYIFTTVISLLSIHLRVREKMCLQMTVCRYKYKPQYVFSTHARQHSMLRLWYYQATHGAARVLVVQCKVCRQYPVSWERLFSKIFRVFVISVAVWQFHDIPEIKAWLHIFPRIDISYEPNKEKYYCRACYSLAFIVTRPIKMDNWSNSRRKKFVEFEQYELSYKRVC